MSRMSTVPAMPFAGTQPCMTAPFQAWPLSPTSTFGRRLGFDHEAQSCLLVEESFGKAKPQSVPHLTIPLGILQSACSSRLAPPAPLISTHLQRDAARCISLPASYLLCHFKPLQQSHKLLLEVWLLKQNKGEK